MDLTKSAENCGIGYITEEILNGKPHFCAVSVTMLNLTCCESSESFPSDENELVEVEVSFRLLFLPYFFFFFGCNVTSGETSLEVTLCVEDSFFLYFFLLFQSSFEERFEDNYSLSLAEQFLSLLLCSSKPTSRKLFSLLVTTMNWFSRISRLSILFEL